MNKITKNIVALTLLALGTTTIANAQVSSQKIGTNPTVKDPSAVLEVEHASKGTLLTRVALTSTTVAAPITAPANALTVFNTATAGDVTPGYYYWSTADAKWIKLATANDQDLRLVGTNSHITQDAGIGGDGTNAGTGTDNILIGANVANNPGFIQNKVVAIGSNVLQNSTDVGNFGTVAIGYNALSSLTTGSSTNFAVGASALQNTTEGSFNTAIGNQALQENITGFGNLAVGGNSMANNTTGSNNTAVGQFSLYNNTGSDNAALGRSALSSNTGSQNVALGQFALQHKVEGHQNTAIGHEAGLSLTQGDNNIFIGNQIQPNVSTTGSNQLNIGNWIYGDNGLIGLGAAAIIPSQRLDVGNGNVRVRDINLPANAGLATDNIVVADADGVLKTITPATLNTEPFQVESTTTKATANTQNIYQNGNIGIGDFSASNPLTRLDVRGSIRGGTPNLAAAIGVNSIAVGDVTEASGINSTAFGLGTIASGFTSTAFGIESKPSGHAATAFGQVTIASGLAATAFGTATVASGINSTTFGNGAVASGEGSTAFGNSTALGKYSTAFGDANISSSYREVVLGANNAITTGDIANHIATDALFQVGNGTTSFVRSNALTILKNGNIGTDIAIAPTERLDIGSNGVRVRDINLPAYAGAATDKMVVADANGVLKTVAASTNAAIRTETANYTAVATDETILGDANGGAVTITLPATPTIGKRYNVKKIDGTVNAVIVDGNGATIDGNATISGTLPFQGWVMQFDGANWFIISRI